MTPLQSTPNGPIFFHFRIKFYIQIANVCSNFNMKFASIGLKLHFCTLSDPIFGGPRQKGSHFFEPTSNDPLLQQNLAPNATYFRSPVGTCTSLSYLSAPSPREFGQTKHRASNCITRVPVTVQEDYLCQKRVAKYGNSLDNVLSLHYALQSIMGRYDSLLWSKL